MTTEQEKLDAVVKVIKGFDSSFSVKQKTASKLMRAVGALLSKIGNPDFTNKFWTTIWSTSYRPATTDQGPAKGEWKVMMHEGQHIVDNQTISRPLFSLLYVLPQALCLLPVLLVLLGLSPWLLLAAPLFLAPLPAPFRAWLEYRGYCVSLAADYWSGKEPNPEWATQYFTTGAYYFMFPFKGFMLKRFERHVASLKDGTVRMTPYMTRCKALAESFGAEAV